MFYQTSVVVVDGKACEKNKHHMEPVNVFAKPVKHSWKWPVKKEKRILPFKKKCNCVIVYICNSSLFSLHHSGNKCRHSSSSFRINDHLDWIFLSPVAALTGVIMGVFNVFFFNVYFETESHCSPGLTGTLDHPALNPKMLCLYVFVTTPSLFTYFKFWCMHRSAQGIKCPCRLGGEVTWRSKDNFVKSLSYLYAGFKDQTQIFKLRWSAEPFHQSLHFYA